MNWDVFDPPNLDLGTSTSPRREHLLREINRAAGSSHMRWSPRSRSWSRKRSVTRSQRSLRRKVALLAAISVVAVLLVLPAMAVVKGWWFLGNGTPQPVGSVDVITSGNADGVAWTLTAFVSKDRGVCVALSPDSQKGWGTEACGAGVRGEPNLSGQRDERRHWAGYVYAPTGSDSPSFVFGPVADGVAAIDVELAGDRTLHTAPVKPPAGFA